MGTFFNVSCPDMDLIEVQKLVEKNGGIYASFGGGFSCPSTGNPSLPEGYEASTIDTRGFGNHGAIVIRATKEEYRLHQIRCIQKILEERFPYEYCLTQYSKRENLSNECLLPALIQPMNEMPVHDGRLLLKWYSNANYVRIGWSTYRLWCAPLYRT